MSPSLRILLPSREKDTGAIRRTNMCIRQYLRRYQTMTSIPCLDDDDSAEIGIIPRYQHPANEKSRTAVDMRRDDGGARAAVYCFSR